MQQMPMCMQAHTTISDDSRVRIAELWPFGWPGGTYRQVLAVKAAKPCMQVDLLE